MISKRKQTIIQMISDGLTSAEIAKCMNYSYALIHKELDELYRETFTNNKAHLVSWAYRNGVL